MKDALIEISLTKSMKYTIYSYAILFLSLSMILLCLV